MCGPLLRGSAELRTARGTNEIEEKRLYLKYFYLFIFIIVLLLLIYFDIIYLFIYSERFYFSVFTKFLGTILKWEASFFKPFMLVLKPFARRESPICAR